MSTDLVARAWEICRSKFEVEAQEEYDYLQKMSRRYRKEPPRWLTRGLSSTWLELQLFSDDHDRSSDE